MDKKGLLVYGCYGYTGELISEHAVKSGLRPTLAGRDEVRVNQMADILGLPYLLFGLDDVAAVANNIAPFKVVLHCAGPFKYTSNIMVNACLKSGTHYLDITGEYQVFEDVFKRDADAAKAKILLMAGVGFDVVPSDCLALYLKEQMPNAEFLELALVQKGGRISHGTAITVAENVNGGCMVRQQGKLVKEKSGYNTRTIDIGDKQPRTGVAISWGDISTAYRSTRIPNITVYNVVPKKVIDSMKLSNYIGFILDWKPVKNYIIKQIKQRPAGPNAEQRQKAQTFVWGEVKNRMGASKQAVLELPEGYTLTALTGVEIAKRILAVEPPYGARTPSQVFGADFITMFEGVKRTDLN